MDVAPLQANKDVFETLRLWQAAGARIQHASDLGASQIALFVEKSPARVAIVIHDMSTS